MNKGLKVAPAAPLAFEPRHRYIPFLLWSLALTLTFGATLGMLNLARLTTPWFGGMPLASVRAHAFVQVFGFVGLFVMGIACHVLPRFVSRPLGAPRLVGAMLALQVGGVAAIVAAFMLQPEVIRWLWIGGSSALVAAAAMFTVVVYRTLDGAAAPDRFERWVVAGALWLAITAAGSLVAAWLGDAAIIAVLWPAALWGFALSWIFGIGRRIFPGFLGWRPRAPQAETAVFAAYQGAVALTTAAAWPLADEPPAALVIAGAIALIAAVAAWGWCIGVRAPRRARHDAEGGYQHFIAAGWIWLGVALAAGPMWSLAAAVTGSVVPPLVTDFARHALAFGFITQVIVGVASRVLPTFTGHPLWSPRLRSATFYLLNVSIILRALEAVVGVGLLPGSWPYIALAGPPAVAAMVLFALNVAFTIRGGVRHQVADGGRPRPARQHDLMPPRVLPWLYFGCAWISLALAFAAVAWDPRGAAGFFYHARLAGIVHLVTLGWITMSILGALYVVAPVALRTPMPARRADAFAFASVVIGIIGMVAHFWIEQFGGMAWSGLMVAAGILHVGGRVVRGLRGAPIHGAVKLHIALAVANIAAAATMGVLLGFDKVYHFLPGFVLSNVLGHAHLAAIGWASMMVVGVAYRMLPMLLPARLPDGRTMYLSAVLLQAGAAGLFVTLMLRSAWVVLFAASAVAGFAAFAAHVAVMLRSRRPPPVDLPSPDYSVRHAFLAIGSLAIAAVLGLVLAMAPASDVTLRLALAYGVFGLVGFLAQMVAGVQLRLLPLLGWFTASRGTTDLSTLGSPHPSTSARLAGVSWLLWLWGVPAMAVGFYFSAIPLLTGGALALEAAVLIGAVQALRAARYAFRSRPVSAGLVLLDVPARSVERDLPEVQRDALRRDVAGARAHCHL